jgi:hypothetical protein
MKYKESVYTFMQDIQIQAYMFGTQMFSNHITTIYDLFSTKSQIKKQLFAN